MLKGVNRNVIVIRSDKNDRFEAVYFVMKKGDDGSKNDILNEANRIVREGAGAVGKRKSLRGGAMLFFGVLIGVLLSSLLWLTVILAAF